MITPSRVNSSTPPRILLQATREKRITALLKDIQPVVEMQRENESTLRLFVVEQGEETEQARIRGWTEYRGKAPRGWVEYRENNAATRSRI